MTEPTDTETDQDDAGVVEPQETEGQPGTPEVSDTGTPELASGEPGSGESADTPAPAEPTAEGANETGVAEAEAQSRVIAPFAAGDLSTPHAYFSLRQEMVHGGSGEGRGTISAVIDTYVVNPSGPALSPQSGSHPTQSVSVPLEADRPADVMPDGTILWGQMTQIQYRVRQSDLNVNSLGVSHTGDAFFTSQVYFEERKRTRSCFLITCESWSVWSTWSTPATSATRHLSVWQVNLETGATTQLVTRSTASLPDFTGGAVNTAGAYYFSHVSAASSPANSMRFSIYRLNGSTPALATTATTTANSRPDTGTAFSGDIAFDGYNNLHLLVGGTGAQSRIAMLTAAQVPSSGSQNVSGLATTSITQTAPASGAQPAGLAFPFGTHAVWQGGTSHLLRSMVAPGTVLSTQTHPGFVNQRDLASVARIPTFQLKLQVVGGLMNPDDRFTLTATPGSSTQTLTTATGTTSTQLAPAALNVTRALTTPVSSTNPTTAVPFGVSAAGTGNLNNYAQAYSCADLTTGATLSSGTVAAATVTVSAIGNRQVECTVTLTRSAPELVVSKQAYLGGVALADGALVEAGAEVEYRLRFDNSTGTAAATGIDYTDHLADVLDDADFVNGSLSIAPTAGLAVAGVTDGALTGETLRVQGALAAGATSTVGFAVTVKPNTDDAEARNPSAVLPPNVPTASTAYDLNNYLVKTGDDLPDTCAVESALCTSHPVRAWSITKLSQPGSGASMNIGGTPNYTIVVEKSDTSMALSGVRVVDDLTDVLKVARWEPTIVPPAPALPQGIYFYDASNTPVGEISANHLPPGTTLADWLPAPVYDDTTASWTLTTAAFDLPANAKFAHVRFSVRLGEPEAAPPGSVNWHPASPPAPDTQFRNTATAHADSTGLAPNRCLVGTPADETPAACVTSHTLVASVVAFRKDGIVTDENGARSKVEDLVGHEFSIFRADAATGDITSDLPANACVNWNSQTATDPADPPNCWRFYPIAAGEQQGRWRSHNLQAGSYWLVETKAPNMRNVNGVLEPISDVQMLAEPIPFRIASSADAAPTGTVPIENGQPAFLRVGQMDVLSDPVGHPGAVTPRCETVNWSAACVNPTGYLMIVSDVRLSPLPLTGGAGTALLTVGGIGLAMAASGGALWWRRRREQADA